MPSNHLRRIIYCFLALTVSIGLIRCSYFFDEKKEEEQVSFDRAVGSCVSEANRIMKNYFSDGVETKVTVDDIDQTIECYRDSIHSFVTNTKSGDLKNSNYNSDNIFVFLEKFYPDYGLDSPRIQSYILLKSFLIGGEVESVSKQEMMRIHELLLYFGETLKNLIPHRRILLRNRALERTREDYDRFQEAFKVFKKNLGSFFLHLDEDSGARSMEMETMATFLFSEFYGEEAEEKIKYLNAVIAFKNLALNRDGRLLKREDLSFFMRQATLTYQAISQFHFFVEEKGPGKLFTNLGHIASFITRIPVQLVNAEIFKTVTLNSVLDIFESGEVVLKYAVRSGASQKIDFSIVQDLLDGLQEAEFIGEPLTSSTLGLFLEKFSEKWIDPQHTQGSEVTSGKITHLRELVEEWFVRQKVVNSLFSDPQTKEVSLVELERPLPGVEELDRWIAVLNRISVHQWVDGQRVLYSKNMGNWTYAELTVSNSMLTLAKLFMAPFNLDKTDPIEYAMTESQAQEVYKVVRILGVEMAFMDSRIANSGMRAFMEANNFSTQKRNDDVMDFYESIEYLSVAMSSGGVADNIYADIPENCKLDYIDVHRRLVSKKECVSKLLLQNYGRYFEHLPTISQFWERADQKTRAKYLGSMEYASRAGVITDKPYDLTEIRVLVSVTNYLQSIFYMFDTSQDGIASGDELRVAERHFKPMISDFILMKTKEMLVNSRWLFVSACGDGLDQQQKESWTESRVEDAINRHLADCLAPKLFIHLLNDGRLPSGNPLTDGATRNFLFLLDASFERQAFATTQATPREVLRVFSALSKVSHSGHVEQVKEFILGRWQELVESLNSEEPPPCLHVNYEGNPREPNVFCEWSRSLFCTESVNQSVFTYFKENKYNLFPVQAYSENPKAAAVDTMENIYFTFAGHQLFSALCAFPKFEKGLISEVGDILQEAAEDVAEPFHGNQEEDGLIDRVLDWFNSL